MKPWIFLFLIMAPMQVWADSFAPETGKTLLFIGQDANTIANYVSKTGTTPGGTMFYTSIQEMKGLTQANEYGAGPQYADALLQYPHCVMQIGLYMVGALSQTIAGMCDAHLYTLAQWLKKANRPVYLRIGYEFDNPSNHYDPQEYIQAYRHVVDFLRSQGVRNVAYVWHSYCWYDNSGHSRMDWYPGDDYVDWFGATLFNMPGQIWTGTDFLKLARAHGKPFMICESSPQGLYTVPAKTDWYKHVFQFIDDQNIEAFCYIDSDWDSLPMFAGQHFGDARVENNEDIKKLWLEETSQERYLNAAPDLFN